ncbi:hypothetical protein ACET3Z_019166 [Daucus carota]
MSVTDLPEANPAGGLAFATSKLDLVVHQPQRLNKAADNGQAFSSYPLDFDHLHLPHLFAYCRVVGSCNGIICLSNRFNNIVYLWNPSIRKCRKLPIPGGLLMIKSPVKIGFGYDSISNDYKVLRIVFERKNGLVPLVQVYSTNADCWKEFRTPILMNWNFAAHLQTNIVVKGVLFFDGGDELISFDSHKDILGLVPFPSCIFRKRSQLLDFEGSVAVVFESIGDGLGIDLWTLDSVSGEDDFMEVSRSTGFTCITSCMIMIKKRPRFMGFGKRALMQLLSNMWSHLFHWMGLNKWSKMRAKSVSRKQSAVQTRTKWRTKKVCANELTSRVKTILLPANKVPSLRRMFILNHFNVVRSSKLSSFPLYFSGSRNQTYFLL